MKCCSNCPYTRMRIERSDRTISGSLKLSARCWNWSDFENFKCPLLLQHPDEIYQVPIPCWGIPSYIYREGPGSHEPGTEKCIRTFGPFYTSCVLLFFMDSCYLVLTEWRVRSQKWNNDDHALLLRTENAYINHILIFFLSLIVR